MATKQVSEVSQSAQILTHLKRGRTVSSLNALNLFGCLRLAARIYELKARGHAIKRDSVQLPGGKRIAVYSL